MVNASNVSSLVAAASLCLSAWGLTGCRAQTPEPVAVGAASTKAQTASDAVRSAELRLESLAVEVAAAAAAAVPVVGSSGTQTTNATPDSAVRRYWEIVDQHNLVLDRFSEFQRQTLNAEGKRFDVVAQTGLYVQTKYQQRPRKIFERRIESAAIETPSRAVVLAFVRNVTPLPKSIKLEKFESLVREKGSRFRYVLINPGDGWRIEEVYLMDLTDTDPKWERARPEPVYLGSWRSHHIWSAFGG